MYRLRGKDVNGKESKHPLAPFRNSGLLRPAPYPTWRFIDYEPWFVRMLEPDVLLGRRGVLGWDRHTIDRGVIVPWPQPTWWDKLTYWWHSLDWNDPWTYVYMGAGLLIVAIGIAVSVLTFGLATPFLLAGMAASGALIGAGVSFGMVGMSTHDIGQAARSAGIGAIGGAIGGLAAGGAMAGVAGALGFSAGMAIGTGGAVAGNAVQAMMHAGILAQVALCGVGGAAGGFAGGVAGTLASGQGWSAALESGMRGAALGAALGIGLPIAGAGLRALGRGIGRALVPLPRLGRRFLQAGGFLNPKAYFWRTSLGRRFAGAYQQFAQGAGWRQLPDVIMNRAIAPAHMFMLHAGRAVSGFASGVSRAYGALGRGLNSSHIADFIQNAVATIDRMPAPHVRTRPDVFDWRSRRFLLEPQAERALAPIYQRRQHWSTPWNTATEQ
jgi:hypothetical protein